MSKIVNQRELAEIVGVSTVTLWQWGREGMPIVRDGENGEENQYDTVQVITWMTQRAVEKATGTEKDRLTRLQADKLELELGELRGNMIRADEIEPMWTSIATAVRQALLPLGIRLAPLLETTTGADAKRELIDEEVRSILEKLSHHDLSSSDDAGQARAQTVRAAAADPPDDVG